MNSEWTEVYCSGCGAEIIGAPVFKDSQYYCCEDCAEGKPCDCALILDDERRTSIEQELIAILF